MRKRLGVYCLACDTKILSLWRYYLGLYWHVACQCPNQLRGSLVRRYNTAVNVEFKGLRE